MKNLKKILALAIAVVMIATLGVSVFAAEDMEGEGGVIGEFTAPDESATAKDKSVTFYKEITWLASTGVTTGWDIAGGKKEFRPFANITRDAMAAFLYRYDQLP